DARIHRFLDREQRSRGGAIRDSRCIAECERSGPPPRRGGKRPRYLRKRHDERSWRPDGLRPEQALVGQQGGEGPASVSFVVKAWSDQVQTPQRERCAGEGWGEGVSPIENP